MIFCYLDFHLLRFLVFSGHYSYKMPHCTSPAFPVYNIPFMHILVWEWHYLHILDTFTANHNHLH